jgi:hypothetical protein
MLQEAKAPPAITTKTTIPNVIQNSDGKPSEDKRTFLILKDFFVEVKLLLIYFIF